MLFSILSLSREGIGNRLYKGFYVVNNRDVEIEFKKIPAAFLSFKGVIAWGLYIFISCFIHYFDTKQRSNSFKIHFYFILLFILPNPI